MENMWSLKRHGSLIWTEASRLLLIKLIGEDPIILSDRFKDRKKMREGWLKVYNELTHRKMPPSSVEKVRDIWYRIRLAAVKIENHNKRNKKQIKLNTVQEAAIKLLQSRKRFLKGSLTNGQDESDEMDSEAEGDDIPENVSTSTSDFSVNETSMTLSTETSEQTLAQSEYWAKMKEVAEAELSLKEAQLENENERIVMEREMHRQNLILVDMRIRQQQIVVENQKLRNTDAHKTNGKEKI